MAELTWASAEVAIQLAANDPAWHYLRDPEPAPGSSARFVLRRERGRLELAEPAGRRRALCLDFHSADIHRRAAAGRRQPLARALGLHRTANLRIIDGTAGLGRDAAVLARLGAQVLMYERSPILAALLADALRRAPELDQNLSLQAADAREASWDSCEAVYLDPMFPATGKTAQPGREMQYLRGLLGSRDDFAILWQSAWAARPPRIVLKQGAHKQMPFLPPADFRQGGGRAVYLGFLPQSHTRRSCA